MVSMAPAMGFDYSKRLLLLPHSRLQMTWETLQYGMEI